MTTAGGHRTTAVASPRTAAGPAARVDKLGVLVAALLAAAATSPLAMFRANRIVAGQGAGMFEALPPAAAVALAALTAAVALVALLRSPARLRLAAAVALLVGYAVMTGVAAHHLTPEGDRFARVAPGAGAWLALFAGGILFADAVARLRLGPAARVGLLAAGGAAAALLLASGVFDGLSILREYEARADAFGREAKTHLVLALGSLAAAVVVGLPLGIVIARVRRLRGPVLGVLNAIQTIPSIALFGMLIGPLGWLAANVPAAAALGVRGIGTAPAFVALFLYALLPMVANTAVGIGGVARDAVEAARGMGMTAGQRLLRVELPLAAPVILTGVRLVLVQSIGLATVAALIGGGGFGAFVFMGIGQTAPDLILLGAVPTVLLAFAAAVVMDAAVEQVRGGRP